MRKYILTEQQIKTIVDNATKNVITEQLEERKEIKSIQQFLNKSKIEPKIKEDGIYGPETKNAIKKYQIHLIKTQGADIVADGVWGPELERYMPEHHKKILNSIKYENDDIFGKMINKVTSIFK